MSLEQSSEAVTRPQPAGPNLLEITSDNTGPGVNSASNAGARPDAPLYLSGTQSADSRVNAPNDARVNAAPNATDNQAGVVTDNTNQPTDAPYGGAQSHQYTVKNGDSLWKIAIHSLAQEHPGERIQGEVIWDRMREIVEANRAQHPEFKDNPFFIKKGDQLVLPGAQQAEAPARAQSHDQGAAHHQGGHHEGGHHDGGHHGRGRRSHHQSGDANDNYSRATEGMTSSDRSNSTGEVLPPNKLSHALKTEACHQADHISTVGDCARGPRQTFAKFGIKLDPQSAVSQGNLLLGSGYFDVVKSEKDLQPGDYGYRHWSEATKNRRGVGDLGDSFIVTDCSGPGVKAANDHHFNVPPSGGYYAKGITYLRPNAKFYAAYEHYKETGEMTVIRKPK